MQIGCHVSISGSIDKSVDNAVERECSAFQIFTRNPRGWHAKELSKEDISNFKSKLKESKIDRFATCAHMPYLPNLASPKDEGFQKSVKKILAKGKTYFIKLDAWRVILLFQLTDLFPLFEVETLGSVNETT